MRLRTLLAAAALTAGLLAVPAPALAGAPYSCTATGNTGCPQSGAYQDPAITNSDGYNTYVEQDEWNCDTDCLSQDMGANNPGDWQVTADMAAGNTAVETYPDVQQLYTTAADTSPAITSFTLIRSTVTESTPQNSGTSAEWGWDIWTSNYPGDVMVWTDTVNRGTCGGATVLRQAVTFWGQQFQLCRNGPPGSGELIFVLNHNEATGTVHLKAMLAWLMNHGYLPQGDGLSQVDAGWELCSTGGVLEQFTVTGYTLVTSPADG